MILSPFRPSRWRPTGPASGRSSLHTGPGVRGGGGVDVALGRHSNLWELPTAAQIAGGLATLAKVLPGDFANWSEQDGLSDAADRLFDVKDRAALTGLHCFSKPPEFACAPVGIKQPVTLVARRNMTATVHRLCGRCRGAVAAPHGGRRARPAGHASGGCSSPGALNKL